MQKLAWFSNYINYNVIKKKDNSAQTSLPTPIFPIGVGPPDSEPESKAEDKTSLFCGGKRLRISVLLSSFISAWHSFG